MSNSLVIEPTKFHSPVPDPPKFSEALRNEGSCKFSGHTVIDLAQLDVMTLETNTFKTHKK